MHFSSWRWQSTLILSLLIHFSLSIPVHPAIKLQVKNLGNQIQAGENESATEATAVTDPSLAPMPGSQYKSKGSAVKDVEPSAATKQVKLYSCNYPGCNYATEKKYNMNRHKKVHTGVRPYSCNQPGCTYTAALKATLKMHKRTHTKEKPYSCDYPGCKYAAATTSGLAYHKRTHEKERGHTRATTWAVLMPRRYSSLSKSIKAINCSIYTIFQKE